MENNIFYKEILLRYSIGNAREMLNIKEEINITYIVLSEECSYII